MIKKYQYSSPNTNWSYFPQVRLSKVSVGSTFKHLLITLSKGWVGLGLIRNESDWKLS